MKRLFFILISILLMIIYINRDYIVKQTLITIYKENTIYKDGKFSNDFDFKYVQKTDDFIPKDKQDIINILYTVIDSDLNEFVFVCGDDYDNCINDILDISNNDYTLAAINNYVHPYNSYSRLEISTNRFGIITIFIEKVYTDTEINFIESAINTIDKTIINNNMNLKEKIKVFHDYIIDNTEYDTEQSLLLDNDNSVTAPSYKATGLFLNNKALCGGYTDAMSIYLYKLDVINYRISSEKHIWNFININNKWHHLDLTWDDPVLSNNQKLVLHDFFLIDTESLIELNTTKHTYDKNLYIEAE